MIKIIGYGVLSFFLTGVYRWLALRYRWLDQPNQRSSHQIITPRGAGVIFALLILGFCVWVFRHQVTHVAVTIAAAGVMLTGWVDDIREVSTRVRFTLYIFFSAIAVYLVSKTSSSNTISFLMYGVIAAIGLSWLINLYNFMDGINGLAALEAIFILLAIALFSRETIYGQTFMQIHLFSCAALTGFLLWNFPTGKVFMGDAGSAFLGFFLGVLMLWSVELRGPSLSVWLILLAVFITDTGYTLLTRMVTGQRWHAAHRSHAYQQLAARLKNNHTHTTLTIMAINLSGLLPMAWLVHKGLVGATWGLALTYTPLIIGCYALNAGIPQRGGV